MSEVSAAFDSDFSDTGSDTDSALDKTYCTLCCDFTDGRAAIYNSKSLSPTNHGVDARWVQTPEMQTLKPSQSVVLIFCSTLICTVFFR